MMLTLTGTIPLALFESFLFKRDPSITQFRVSQKSNLFNGLPKPWTLEFAILCILCRTPELTTDNEGKPWEIIHKNQPQVGIEPATPTFESQIQLASVVPQAPPVEAISIPEKILVSDNFLTLATDSDKDNRDSNLKEEEWEQFISTSVEQPRARLGALPIRAHSFIPSSLYTLEEEEDEEEFPMRLSATPAAKPLANGPKYLESSGYTIGNFDGGDSSCNESNASSDSGMQETTQTALNIDISEVLEGNGDDIPFNNPTMGIVSSTGLPLAEAENPCPSMEDINEILAKMFGTSEPITDWDDEVELSTSSQSVANHTSKVNNSNLFESTSTSWADGKSTSINAESFDSGSFEDYGWAFEETTEDKTTLKTVQNSWVIKRMPMYRIPQLPTLVEQEEKEAEEE